MYKVNHEWKMRYHDLIYVWIHGEIDRITISHHDYGKNYTLELQQNHDDTIILPNSRLIQTHTKCKQIKTSIFVVDYIN